MQYKHGMSCVVRVSIGPNSSGRTGRALEPKYRYTDQARLAFLTQIETSSTEPTHRTWDIMNTRWLVMGS